jgi:hypothetical protein
VSAGPRSGGGWLVRTVLRLAPPPGGETAAGADGTLAGAAAEDG